MNAQALRMKSEGSPTLSIVAISYNEEVDLPGFLNHLLPWVDEVIIVDDGSTDRTVDIVESAGSKVKLIRHKMTKEGGFAEQRNQGIAAATSDWVLNMDIDERVTPQLAADIRLGICNTRLHAFRYHRLNFFLHRPMRRGGWNSWNNPQLARRGYHRYVNRIHERCVIEGEPATVGQLESVMWHLNDDSYEERMRKSFQYCKLEADKMSEQNITVTWPEIVYRPILEFVKKYFYKCGFVDGIPGLIAAMHSASAIFRQYALAWDAQHDISRTTLEKQLQDEWSKCEHSPDVTHQS